MKSMVGTFRKTESMPRIRIKLLSSTAKAPQYMTAGAAGADVFADFGRILDGWMGLGRAYSSGRYNSDSGGHLTRAALDSGTVKIPLGFAVEIPEGWVGLLKGRSGLAKDGNDAHVAAIDSDYRGEVCMLLHIGEAGATINHGDRVGQILFMPAPQFELVVVDELSDTARGEKGFGSSGR